MTLAQEIMLYFEIIPLLAFLALAAIESYFENRKAFNDKIWALRKAFIEQNEEYERQEFLWETKNGLSNMNR